MVTSDLLPSFLTQCLAIRCLLSVTCRLRGVTVLGASGDGGSHFSFEPFSGGGELSSVLNKISCEFQFPVFPTSSPYVLSVGGEAWENGDMNKPVAWEGSGGGFSWQFPALDHQTETIASYLQTTHGA